MLVKILSRSTPSFKGLIQYILDESKSSNGIPQVITRNLRSNTIEGYTNEFLENESFRMQERSNQVYLYHEIISLGKDEDKSVITKEMLTDITNQYMTLRGQNGVYLAAIHEDKAHTHIHIASGGVQYRTGIANRMSHVQLKELKTNLQEYHKQKYPELTKSFCEHGKDKEYLTDKAWQRANREQRTYQKSEIIKIVQTCFKTATSKQEFLDNLRNTGLSHYERGNKIQGIITEEGMKFRFTRLDIDINQLPETTQKIQQQIKNPLNNLIMEKQFDPQKVFLEYKKGGEIKYDAEQESYYILTETGDSIPISETTHEYLKNAQNISFNFESKDMEEQLEKIYERKNDLFNKIHNSATPIADQATKDELDALIREEARILTRYDEMFLLAQVDDGSKDIIDKALESMPKEGDREYFDIGKYWGSQDQKDIAEKNEETEQEESAVIDLEEVFPDDDLEIDNYETSNDSDEYQNDLEELEYLRAEDEIDDKELDDDEIEF